MAFDHIFGVYFSLHFLAFFLQNRFFIHAYRLRPAILQLSKESGNKCLCYGYQTKNSHSQCVEWRKPTKQKMIHADVWRCCLALSEMTLSSKKKKKILAQYGVQQSHYMCDNRKRLDHYRRRIWMYPKNECEAVLQQQQQPPQQQHHHHFNTSGHHVTSHCLALVSMRKQMCSSLASRQPKICASFINSLYITKKKKKQQRNKRIIKNINLPKMCVFFFSDFFFCVCLVLFSYALHGIWEFRPFQLNNKHST